MPIMYSAPSGVAARIVKGVSVEATGASLLNSSTASNLSHIGLRTPIASAVAATIRMKSVLPIFSPNQAHGIISVV